MRLLKVPKGPSPFNYTALAVYKASNILIAARDDGVVDLWSLQRLLKVSNLESPDVRDIAGLNPEISLAIHESGSITCVKVYETFFLSADHKGTVYKTSLLNNHESIQIFAHNNPINDIEIFHDIALFATLTKVISFNLKTAKQLTPILTRSDVRSLSLDPSQNFLVFIAINKAVYINQIQYTNGDIITKRLITAKKQLHSINTLARISWSPVGDRFAIPNPEMGQEGCSIGIVKRSTWKDELSLIGQNPVVIKFSSQLIREGDGFANIIASIGLDRSVAVWNTTFQRPLFTANDVSINAINDLVWTDDGTSFILASDTLSVFVMDQKELGIKVPDSVIDDLKAKLKKVDMIPIKPPALIEPAHNETKSNISANENSMTSKPSITQDTHETENNIQNGTKNGKRNTQSSLIPGNNNSTTVRDGSANGRATMEFDPPSYSVPKDLKRKEEASVLDAQQQPPVKRKREIEAVEFIGSVAINPSSSFAKIRVSTSKIRSSFVLESPNDETLSLEIRNGSGNEQKPTKITLLKNSSKQIFTDFIPKLIGLATGGEGFFWATSTIDGVVYVYTDSGRRVFPPLVLGTPLSFLESKGRYLMAVTSIGEVYAWDVVSKKALFEPTSLYPLLARSNPELLTRAENLTLCSITSSGVPIVTVSNGNGYLFDRDMEAWCVISDSWWAFGSQYWDSRDPRANTSIINLLEKKTNDEIIRRGRGKFLQKMAKTMLMKEGYENLEKTISLAHLENRILISTRLKEDVEFKSYLIIYCRRVSEMGFKSKLYEIFNDLMGPQGEADGSSQAEWDSKVLSFDKHELLKELIFACAHIRAVQRILIQFATALKILDQITF